MDQVQQAYSATAAEYIDLLGSIGTVNADDLDLIARHLCDLGGPVLDVGCGPGHLTAHLQSLDVEVIGVDPVPEFIDHARATYPRCRFQLGSTLALPFPDGSVAGALAWYSLIHLHPSDMDGALAELRRVLAPGGTLVLGFFDGGEVSDFAHAVVTATYWPVDELSARLQRAGFTEVERQRRPGVAEPGRRPHAAIVAAASDDASDATSATMLGNEPARR